MFLTELPKLNSIKIGNIIHKPRGGIEKLAAQSVRLVTLEDKDHPEYLGYRGSCTLVKNGTDNFIACTRHQLGLEVGQSPDVKTLRTLRFVSQTDSDILKNIPTDNCLFVENNEDEEYHDILLFHVPNDHPTFLPERPNFFPLQNFSLVERQASWIVGCPTDKMLVKYEPQSVHIVTHMFDCAFNVSFKSNAQHFKQVTYDKNKSNMDGFSGGAVFSFFDGENGWEIVFDGIIVRAGNGVAHIVDASFILQAAKKFKVIETVVDLRLL